MKETKKFSYTYSLTEKEYTEFNVWQTLVMRRGNFYSMIIIPVLAIGLLVFTIINELGSINLFLAIFFSVYPLGRYWSQRQVSKQQYQTIKEQFQNINITFNSFGVTLKKEETEQSFQWKDIYQIRVKKHTIIIFVNEQQAFVVPKAPLTKEQLESLYEFFLEKLDIIQVIF